MKMEALTTFMKDRPEVKKVYLLNQNYAHGHQVAKYAKDILPRKRPDVQFVGEDLHPLASVRDFAPYVAKIKASGADTVITGNWGSDLSLLVKAANDAGLNVNFYTYYAGVTGTPTALGTAAAGKVFQVSYMHSNMDCVRVRSFLASRPSTPMQTGIPARPITSTRCSATRWPRPSPPTPSRSRQPWKA